MMPNVTVSEFEGVRYLHLGTPWVQGAMRLDRPDALELEYVRQMMMWSLFKERPGLIGQLGLGAGSLARFCHLHFPDAHVHVAELNPEVLRACRHLFDLPQDSPRLHVHIGDAHDYVRVHPGRFDVLQVDLYGEQADHPVLESPGFYQDCADSLRPDGLLTVNLLGNPLVHARNIHALQQAFEAVAWLPESHDGNIVAIAFRQAPQIDFEELYRRAEALHDELGLDAAGWVDGLMAWMQGD